MQRVEWDPAMETGDAAVDEQHRGLVELFNGLLEAEHREDSHELARTLERLCDYVIVHFAAEEALMRRVGYPKQAVEEHLDEHESLTGRTREIVVGYRTGEITTLVPVVDFLGSWLSEHIARCDRTMVEFARTRA